MSASAHRRVRDLFEQAKKVAPAIIFIDEIDAVGRQRGAGLGGGHDEREQTLNQLLVEMDGFGSERGRHRHGGDQPRRTSSTTRCCARAASTVRSMSALPDIKGREAILKVHARNKPLGRRMSSSQRPSPQATAGFTGADLENLLNEAALLAARRGKQAASSCRRISRRRSSRSSMGPEKKSRVVHRARRASLTAYHEAGHADRGRAFLTDARPRAPYHHHPARRVQAASTMLAARRRTGGRTTPTASCMEEHRRLCLGGRVAEKLFLDDISTGASGDIQQATQHCARHGHAATA